MPDEVGEEASDLGHGEWDQFLDRAGTPLSRAAVADPAAFRRKASAVRGAAAVTWVICRANETVGAYYSGLTVQELLAWFGVKGSVSQRAEPFIQPTEWIRTDCMDRWTSVP